MKTYNSTFTSDIKKPGVKQKWRVVFTYDAGTSFPVYTNAGYDGTGFTGDGYGLVTYVSPIESGVSPVNSSFEIPSVEVRLTDGNLYGTLTSGLTDKTLSGFLNGKNFRNRTVNIYRITEAMASISNHDAEFTGIVSDYFYDNTTKEWVFKLVGNVVKYDKLLPDETVNLTDYPNAPRSSLGMPIPFVYGSFTLGTYDAAHNLYHLAPTVCTDKIAGNFTIASHALYGLTSGEQYVFLPGLGVYGGALSAQDGATYPSVTLTAPSYLTLPAAEYFKLVFVYLIPSMKGSINTVGTITNIVDNDVNTTVAITGDYYARFPSLQGDGEFLKDATSAQMYNQIAGYAYVTAYSGANTTILSMYNPDSGTAYEPAGTGFNTTGFKTSNDGVTPNGFGIATNRTDNTASGTAWAGGATTQWSWEEIARYEYGLNLGASVTCTISVAGIRIENLIISGASLDMYSPNMPRVRGGTTPNRREGRRDNSRSNPYRVNASEFYPLVGENRLSNQSGYNFTGFSAVFTQCQGRKFGSWIDDVGRSNSYNQNNLISLSNFIIESVLRDELGVPSSEIDVSTFDDAESGAYSFTFSQNEFVSGSELIQQLSFFSRSITTCKSNGEWKLYQFEDTPAASDDSLDWHDVRILSISDIDAGAMANDVTIVYNYDYGKQQYTHDTNAEDTTSKGSTSDGINRTALAKFECPYIRAFSSGTNYSTSIRDFLLAQWKTPHREVTFEVIAKDKWGIEELDVIEFSNFETNIAGIGAGSSGDYWSSFASPALKYWLVTRRVSTLDKVVLTAMQLHDLS